ncbi:MAG: SGNH/GDSL hydrolase family protein [Pseudomonadota bacterium]
MKALTNYFLYLLILLALPINTLHADTLVVFGDSLSDTGNLAAALNQQGITFPAEAFDGRASNGIVAVEVLAALLNTTIEPSLFLLGLNAGGNYAVATARARVADDRPIHFPYQLNAYLLNTNGIADADATFVIQIGGNDVRDAFFADGDETYSILQAALLSLQSNIDLLINSGARKILVSNSANLTEVPEIITAINNSISVYEKRRKRFKAQLLSLIFNHRLQKILSLHRHQHQQSDLVIAEVKIPELFKFLKKNQSSLGFVDIKNGCLLLNLDSFQYSRTVNCDLDNDIDHFLFFDQIHLSAAGHEYLGRYLYLNTPR